MTEDLGFSHDHGIEAGRHRETMPDRVLVPEKIVTVAEFLDGILRAGKEVFFDFLDGFLEMRRREINFDPVTSGQKH